jgi:hypothetical protein
VFAAATIDRGVSSALIFTESLRTLDRVRLQATLSDIEVARRRCAILALLDSLELVQIDSIVSCQLFCCKT